MEVERPSSLMPEMESMDHLVIKLSDGVGSDYYGGCEGLVVVEVIERDSKCGRKCKEGCNVRKGLKVKKERRKKETRNQGAEGISYTDSLPLVPP